MNSYPSMGVAATTASNLAQFYQHAASAAAAGVGGPTDALGVGALAYTQPSAGQLGSASTDISKYPWMSLVAEVLYHKSGAGVSPQSLRST
uniref:Uncharacterized protein n=1 Tax=Megaselia scalaris TaxID=36166 RepID=T1GDW1_MEGSC